MSHARYRALLDPGMVAYIERAESLGDSGGSPPEQRQRYRERSLALRGPPVDGVSVTDMHIETAQGGVAARTYLPEGEAPGTALYLHGGGWVVGDLETHDDICRDLAAQSGCRVVAVDYRRAPEHPYPAAFEDCLAALLQLQAADPAAPLVTAGDSAGGNLAAALALYARDTGLAPLAGQVLVYPALSAEPALPSHTEFAEAPLLTRADMQVYLASYLGGCVPDAYAAPLLATDFSALAPACVVPAACDPLRDDGIVYANKLLAAGTPVTLHVAEGLAHAFIRARHQSEAAARAFSLIARAIRDLSVSFRP